MRTNRERERQRERERERETEPDRDKETDGDTETQRETERERKRKRHRDRERESVRVFMTRAVYRVLPASFRGHSCACCRSLRRAVAVAGAHCSDLPLPGERLEALRRAISS